MAGEGHGPFCPTSKHANTLIGGFDLLYTDIVAVRYMGFDPNKIKYLNFFIEKYSLNLDQFNVFVEGVLQDDFFSNLSRYKDFLLPEAWNIIKINNGK